jgi:polyisoprenyl-teichoic acid--peptidoglycan teichoic acid transferase
MTQSSNRNMARAPQRKTRLDTTTKILLIAFAVVGLLLAYFGGKAVFNLVKSWSLTNLPGAPVDNSSGVLPSDGGVVPADPLQSSGGPQAQAWDGKSRINILLLGLDYSPRRAAEEQGSPLSDTMILVTVDPLSRTIGAISIRRDLWVNIPGFDYNKINAAYKLGEDYNLPGGGAGLAMKTVESFLGVPVNFYARVEFDSFVRLIDEIQGVKVTITEPMTLDWNGSGEKFTLEPGEYVLPGNYALAYARTRDYGEGDIDRGNRQMEVIQAVRNRVLDFDMMPTLITNAPAIFKEIQAGVETNMSLNQAIQLALLMTQIPRENMKTYNIDFSMASPEIIPEGSILRPMPDKIRELRDLVFAQGSAAAAPIAMGNGDPLALAKAEGARIAVLNGTGAGGLAETTGAYLTSQGLNVVNAASADENYTYTTIVVHNATPYTLAYLSAVMQVPNNRIYNRFDPNGSADITVYLGSDWANSNPMP